MQLLSQVAGQEGTARACRGQAAHSMAGQLPTLFRVALDDQLAEQASQVWASSPGPALLPSHLLGLLCDPDLPCMPVLESSVCFYPGLVLPTMVQTLRNLRHNSRDAEAWLQVPDGVCGPGLSCSEQVAAFTHSPTPHPQPAFSPRYGL